MNGSEWLPHITGETRRHDLQQLLFERSVKLSCCIEMKGSQRLLARVWRNIDISWIGHYVLWTFQDNFTGFGLWKVKKMTTVTDYWLSFTYWSSESKRNEWKSMAALKSRAKALRTCMTCSICVLKVCFETNVTFRLNKKKTNGSQWLLATFRKYK